MLAYRKSCNCAKHFPFVDGNLFVWNSLFAIRLAQVEHSLAFQLANN